MDGDSRDKPVDSGIYLFDASAIRFLLSRAGRHVLWTFVEGPHTILRVGPLTANILSRAVAAATSELSFEDGSAGFHERARIIAAYNRFTISPSPLLVPSLAKNPHVDREAAEFLACLGSAREWSPVVVSGRDDLLRLAAERGFSGIRVGAPSPEPPRERQQRSR